jgi:hypothetical protein
MAFWSDGTGMEPKRAYRWILDVSGIPAYTIKKVSKPSFTISESSHQFLNHTYYYPGRVEWSTISFTLVDPVNPDAASALLGKVMESGYQPALKDTDRDTLSKAGSLDALGEPKIIQIDEDGDPVETWTLHNAWIKDVKFGELDYSSDDMVEIQVELRFDYATCVLPFGLEDFTPAT